MVKPHARSLIGTGESGKKDNIKVILIQAEFDDKNAITLANEIGAKVVRINPLSYDWDKEMINIAKAIAQKSDE